MATPIQPGCNYHTTWQRDPRMRFVLDRIKGEMAQLSTRTTGKVFWTKLDTLIFIDTAYNWAKLHRLEKENKS